MYTVDFVFHVYLPLPPVHQSGMQDMILINCQILTTTATAEIFEFGTTVNSHLADTPLLQSKSSLPLARAIEV